MIRLAQGQVFRLAGLVGQAANPTVAHVRLNFLDADLRVDCEFIGHDGQVVESGYRRIPLADFHAAVEHGYLQPTASGRFIEFASAGDDAGLGPALDRALDDLHSPSDVRADQIMPSLECAWITSAGELRPSPLSPPASGGKRTFVATLPADCHVEAFVIRVNGDERSRKEYGVYLPAGMELSEEVTAT